MSQFFDRRFELLVDGEPFIAETSGQQFKVVFKILVDFGGFNSFADIAIYNLAQNTSKNVLKKGLLIELRAGYKETIDTIFKGNISNVLREREGASTITRLIAKGGSLVTAQNINKSFGKGVKLTALIAACVSAMGYQLDIDESQFSEVYNRGYLLNGDPKELLESLSKASGFQYTTENDRVVVIKNGKFRKGAPVVISQFNGMEGIPEITEVGVDVVTRINPKVKMGRQIDIQSELVTFNFSNLYFQDIPEAAGTGIFNIHKLEYDGDTKGDSWSVKITGFRPEGGL